MKEEIMLPNNKIKAEGKIIIEYTNGETGEVENKFESENHVFPGSFAIANPYGFASNSSGGHFGLFVSDRGDNINYDLPFIPGNIIGCGYPGSTASGENIGAENIEARSLGVYSDGMWHYKRQWSWLPNQIKSEIKSFGLASTNAIGANYDERSKWMTSTHQLPIQHAGDVERNGHCSYDNGFCYSADNFYFNNPNVNNFSAYVNMYHLDQSPTQTTNQVYLKDLIPMPDNVKSSNAYFNTTNGHGMLAFDIDTGDMLVIILYKGTDDAAYVQITRLDAEFTTMKSNMVYSCGTYITVNSSHYPFTGYRNSSNPTVGYYSNGKFYTPYGKHNLGYAIMATIDPNMWSSSGDFFDAFTFNDVYYEYSQWWPFAYGGFSFAVKNKIPVFYSYYGSQVSNPTKEDSYRPALIVMNPQDNKPYATRYAYCRDANNYYFGKPFANLVGDDIQMLQHVCYYRNNSSDVKYIDNDQNYYRNVGDFTLYVLPDNAPKREEGQGVTITYEIAWGYEEDN